MFSPKHLVQVISHPEFALNVTHTSLAFALLHFFPFNTLVFPFLLLFFFLFLFSLFYFLLLLFLLMGLGLVVRRLKTKTLHRNSRSKPNEAQSFVRARCMRATHQSFIYSFLFVSFFFFFFSFFFTNESFEFRGRSDDSCCPVKVESRERSRF